jgi:hypothetical protein
LPTAKFEQWCYKKIQVKVHTSSFRGYKGQKEENRTAARQERKEDEKWKRQ